MATCRLEETLIAQPPRSSSQILQVKFNPVLYRYSFSSSFSRRPGQADKGLPWGISGTWRGNSPDVAVRRTSKPVASNRVTSLTTGATGSWCQCVPEQDRHSQFEAARAGQPPTSKKRELAELELRNTAHREPRRERIVSFNINYTSDTRRTTAILAICTNNCESTSPCPSQTPGRCWRGRRAEQSLDGSG